MTVYKDDFGNRAEVVVREIIPYRGSTRKEMAWQLSCYAEYDRNHMYFRSLFDTEMAMLRKLQEFSCGTFKEVAV